MFQHKIISILFKISASALFLKFRKFQPRYSYKIYSYKKKRVYLDKNTVRVWLPELKTMADVASVMS